MHGGDPVKIAMVGSKAAQAVNYAIYSWGSNQYGNLGIDSLTYIVKYPTPTISPQTWTAMFAGDAYAFGISGGRLYAWGRGTGHVLGLNSTSTVAHPGSTVNNSTQWTVASAYTNHSAGICGGLPYCWGQQSFGKLGNGQTGTAFVTVPQGVSFTGGTGWTKIVCGSNFTVGICGGQLYAWGRNEEGQLGQGTTVDSGVPLRVGTSSSWTDVDTGDTHVVGICGGVVYSWGYNAFSNLGVGDTTNRYVPTGVCGGYTNVVAVFCERITNSGANFMIRGSTVDGGTLMAWGYNGSGRLGDGTTSNRSAPVTIPGKWKMIWTYGGTSVGVCGDEMWSWGNPNQLGYRMILDRNATSTSPQRVTSLGGKLGTGWSYFGVGGSFFYGKNGLTMYASGDGRNYVFTDTSQISPKTTPQFVVGITNDTNYEFPDIGYGCGINTAAGGFIVYRDGSAVRVFGQGAPVQISTTSLTQAQEYPIQGHTSGYSFLSLGAFHAHGISGGGLWGWGLGFDGRIGVGNTTTYYRSNPQRIGTSSSWTAVASGEAHTLGICGGALWAWGNPAQGALGNGLTTGTYNSPILISGSTAWTWVSAGNQSSHGICGGQLWGWGLNTNGKVGSGSTAANVTIPQLVSGATGWTRVYSSQISTYGICGGNLYTWGSNTNSSLGDGTTIPRTTPTLISASRNWTHLAPGANYCLGVCGGQLWAWGRNSTGQLGDGTFTERSSPVRIGTASDWVAVKAGDVFSYGIKKV